MLYLAIDQHRKQLTVNIRNEKGDVVLKRQVSTQWERVRMFFDGLRRVVIPGHEDEENRQLTALRKRMGAVRTRTVNKVHHILLKHNLHQECPLKDIKGKKARRWLAELPLGSDARLPQLGRRHQPAGFDHQARQPHGPIHSRSDGAACVAA